MFVVLSIARGIPSEANSYQVLDYMLGPIEESLAIQKSQCGLSCE